MLNIVRVGNYLEILHKKRSAICKQHNLLKMLYVYFIN